jgi:hypothetical protein
MVDNQTKAHENAVRRMAERLGFFISKSSANYWRRDNWQLWQIRTMDGAVVAGERYDLSLSDVERFLAKCRLSVPAAEVIKKDLQLA